MSKLFDEQYIVFQSVHIVHYVCCEIIKWIFSLPLALYSDLPAAPRLKALGLQWTHTHTLSASNFIITYFFFSPAQRILSYIMIGKWLKLVARFYFVNQVVGLKSITNAIVILKCTKMANAMINIHKTFDVIVVFWIHVEILWKTYGAYGCVCV